MINDFSLQINETQGLMNKDLQYDKNLNPFNRTKFKSNENQMKILSELIERESPIKEEETFTQTKEKDTVLMVTKNRSNKAIFKTDNNALPKENIHLLAKEILTRCNVFHKKNIHNNTALITNKGKLMITKGMSVKDFQNRYHL